MKITFLTVMYGFLSMRASVNTGDYLERGSKKKARTAKGKGKEGAEGPATAPSRRNTATVVSLSNTFDCTLAKHYISAHWLSFSFSFIRPVLKILICPLI
jgi:hypothetical protein